MFKIKVSFKGSLGRTLDNSLCSSMIKSIRLYLSFKSNKLIFSFKIYIKFYFSSSELNLADSLIINSLLEFDYLISKFLNIPFLDIKS